MYNVIAALEKLKTRRTPVALLIQRFYCFSVRLDLFKNAMFALMENAIISLSLITNLIMINCKHYAN